MTLQEGARRGVPTRVGGATRALRTKFLDGVDTFGEMVLLGLGALRFMVVDIVRRRFSWREFFDQAWFMTRVAFLPTVLVAIPFGIIIAIQVGAVAQQIGAVSFTGAVNGIGILRQAAPLVTSLLMAGAVGSAICAQLGAQTVREEVDAMKVMGLNPVQRIVAPRIAAAMAVGFLLNIVVAATAMLTGYVINVGGGHVSSGAYLASFISFAQPTDLVLAEGKAVIFGFLATVIAAHKGLNAKGGPKGVADAVNQCVVIAVIVLAVVNVAITQGYSMLVPARIA
ncbi:ABC transporter permease [Aeromicrobium sp. Leaf350]|uniref:MlaE family ABC transporter permease n=1 Tax=Aeromicrobium sp. Leaf350 TaxID=2876565 RepID=UPI001E3A2D3E|nr:ABC transporter permease [Aeromicrobium sp. Leaf350]